MFKDKSLFAILGGVKADAIARIELTRDTQKDVCQLFENAYNELLKNKSSIIFNGTYKPDKDENLFISDFKVDKYILDAVKNPIGTQAFVPDLQKLHTIKALFVGKSIVVGGKDDKFTIAFQKFRNDQYISRKGLNLFHDKNTFNIDKRYGLSINELVDCIFEENKLIFNSYHFARQIFDLSEYYREATDTDVEGFINNPKIQIEDTTTFKSQAVDSWVRRKIALIDDSGIFNKYSVQQIKNKAKSIGMTLPVKQNKINFPSDKRELKNLLKFLDDEIYKGMFSEEILQTNSKRKAEI